MGEKELLDLSKMSPADYQWVVKSVKKEKGRRPYKNPGEKFEIYLKLNWSVHLEACMEYAYQKHWIKSKTKYAFGGWCVERGIESVLGEIYRSKQNSDLKDSPD